MFGGPVEHVGADRLELGEDGPDDLEVQVVTHVDPDDHEEEEVGSNNGAIKVVEKFGSLEGKTWSAHDLHMVKGENLKLTARKKSLISWVV